MRYFSILWKMHQFFTNKISNSFALKIVQIMISLVSSTQSSLYVFLLQIKPVVSLFLSPCCSPDWCRYLYKPSSGGTFSSRYVLSSSTISTSIASVHFIQIINNFVLLILFTLLSRFLIQIANTFSGSWNSWASMMGLSNCFAISFFLRLPQKLYECAHILLLLIQPQHCVFQATLSHQF